MKLTNELEGIELDGPDLDEGEVIADVVILCRLMKANEKHSSIAVYTSDHTDAIVQMGIVHSANLMLSASVAEDE